MYEILKSSEKFDNLDKMETTSSESKVKMEGPGKWLVTALVLKTKARLKFLRKLRSINSNIKALLSTGNKEARDDQPKQW